MGLYVRRPGLRARVLVGAAAFAAFAAFQVATASASSCVYDANTKEATVTLAPGEAASAVVSAGEILVGAPPSACLGATTTTTDLIRVVGASGSNETFTIDERAGKFGPGAAPDNGSIREIEFSIELGDATDTLVYYATEGADSIAPGQNGFSNTADGDTDVLLSPNPMRLEINALGGDDYINGFGQFGAGLHFLGPLTINGGEGDDVLVRGSTENDVLTGGPGNDIIEGNSGNDLIDAGDGADTIRAGDGDDDVTGGSGADSFTGNYGADIFRAQDDEADAGLNGGPGSDTAYVDSGLDPTALSVETIVGDNTPPPPPPPPPPGGCGYDAAAAQVTATIASGGSAQLVVVGGAIHFGDSPAACGAATVANTDTISITGVAGSTESLTIDQSGGAFAPGATAESTGVGEIEIQTALGDAGDVVVVLGTPGNDVIVVGATGVGLTGDGDSDVSFAPMPAAFEIRGLGGVNTLTGLGGSGNGSIFTGSLTLWAGDAGDALTGGNGHDTLVGGAGNDALTGRTGNDSLDGGPGNDSLSGSDGDDTLVGGSGADSFIGSSGADTIRADDDEADTAINGGQDADTAYYDLGIDPVPVATENRIPA